MTDKEKTRDYVRGYLDQTNDKPAPSASVLDIVVGALVPGVDPAGSSKDYWEGRRDAKR